MSSYDLDREPERLIHGKFGKLLRDANRELALELDQQAAFRRINQRLAHDRRLSSVRWLLPATPFAAAALAALLFFAHKHRPDSAPELVAESWRSDAKLETNTPATAAVSAAHAEETPLRRTDDEPEARNVKRSAARSPARSATNIPAEPQQQPALTPHEAASVSEPPRAPAASPPKADEPSEAPDCLSLARRGQTRAAESCFLERAHGSGLEAEMALYEVARLRRDVLADAEGALSALAEYRKRFPAGSLRREADMSQLELLLQLGRNDEALKQSDELLSSSASGERATELRLLRGHILRKQSRFAEAAREYELAGGAGKRGSEATYFRGICLEALGRGAEAAEMFTQYLQQPGRPYAEDAKRRLERLKP